MKKQFLSKLALATLALTFCGYTASAQLGNLKNKVKNAANNATGNNNSSSSSGNNTSSNDPTPASTNNNSSSGSAAASGDNLNWYKVDKSTTVFSADYGFASIKTAFKTGENIYVRFAFPKSVTDAFNEKFPNHQKSTAKYSLAISKNIDTDPIIIAGGTFSVYNYEKVNMMDFTISGDPKTFDSFDKLVNQNKISMRSAATMSDVSMSTQWEALAPTFTSDMKDWEIFLIFAPGDEILDDRKPELVNQGKFSFTYDANASNSKYAEYMKPIKPVADEGVTSDMHKKYMKQVVFSKTPIAKTPSESALTNTFNLGDDIYFRVFMERSFVNESNAIGYSLGGTPQKGATAYEVFIDGKPLVDMPGTKNDRDGYAESEHDYPTTFTKGISRTWGTAADKGKDYSKILLDFYYNTALLSPGPHKVKVSSTYYVPANGATPDQQYQKAFGKEKLMATGEFTLNVTEAGKIAVGKKLCSMSGIKQEIDYFSAKAPAKVPQAPEWVKKNLTEKGTNATLVKVVEGDEWAYIKNGFGIITHRELWGNAFLLDKETGLYYSRRIKYTQQNISSGGSSYGSTVWEWNDYDNVGIRFPKECLGK